VPHNVHDEEERVRAVQYVRMSSDQQQYSLANQTEVIAEYADRRGYEIIATYVDAGKSGLSLKGRQGLQQLLTAVLHPERAFDAILVLDVSRWGRFQDPDQSAHYEFICRQAGLTVAYCAEPFENNLSPMSTIAKHLKRVMAGEYSRELSERLSRAHLQQARLGFRQGGSLPYGFRRMLIDEHGRPKFLLGLRQRKALSNDHVITVLGSAYEQAIIKKIFHWYVVREMPITTIAEKLSAEGVIGTRGGTFSAKMVQTVLKSEYCIGHYVYNRTTNKLQSPRRNNPENLWVRARAAKPIISVKMFRKAQDRLTYPGGPKKSEKEMLRILRRLLKRNGYLSRSIINKSASAPHTSTYRNHFGTLKKAYARIGWKMPEWSPIGTNGICWTDEVLLTGLKRLRKRIGYVSNKAINRDPNLPSAAYIRRRFGSMAHAHALCGFPVGSRSKLMQTVAARHRTRLAKGTEKGRPWGRRYSSKELIQSLRRLAKQHGYLSLALIEADPSVASAPVFIRRFGSLRQAYTVAGWLRTRGQLYAERSERRCAAGYMKAIAAPNT
jgi:DNA invertase Pin-like site-specific DNA recombinase